MQGKWGAILIVFALLAAALPITGISQVSEAGIIMPQMHVANRSITGNVIITLAGLIPSDSVLSAYIGEELVSSRNMSRELGALEYSYPLIPFNYTIRASGSIVSYSQQNFSWTITAGGTRITGEPWSVEHSGSGQITGPEGLKYINSMSGMGVTYPSDISGDIFWSVIDSSPNVETVMREACGSETYEGMTLDKYGWVLNRALGGGWTCGNQNCLQENDYSDCWCSMVGSRKVTAIEPFEGGGLADNRSFPAGEPVGGIYRNGVYQNRPQDVEWEPYPDIMYIADTDNHRIVRASTENGTWDTICSSGTGSWRLRNPYGVFYDVKDGYVYISDYNNHRIVRARMDGSSWVAYGSSGSGTGQFRYPRGIYVYPPTGDIYVADKNNHRIVRTTIVGTGWLTLGGAAGSGTGQFRYPNDIYYDAGSGYVYVADTGNHRIVKTRMDGSSWVAYGSSGSGTGQFRYPNGTFYDKFSDYIYVADTGNHRIVRTRMDGSGWESYGSQGSGRRQFNGPSDVHYDHQTGYIYVADTNNNRVVKFKWDGSYWEVLGGAAGSGTGQFRAPKGIVNSYSEGITIPNFDMDSQYTISYFTPNGERLCAFTNASTAQPWENSTTRNGNVRYLETYSINYSRSGLGALLGIPPGVNVSFSISLEPRENMHPSFTENPDGSYTLTVYTDSQKFSSPVNVSVGLEEMHITAPAVPGDYTLTLNLRYGSDLYFSETGSFGICPDADSDGYALAGSGCHPEDCDDSNAGIHPGVYDIPDNGIDENCDGIDGITDIDGDGFNNTYTNGSIWDCNDTAPGINPNASEACNGLDDNCDGITDNVFGGNSAEAARCQCFGGLSPETESCNGIDDDCDGRVDGMKSPCSLKYIGECAAGNETCALGQWVGCPAPADESCDGKDNDCDGEADEGARNSCLDYSTCQAYDTCNPCPERPFESCNGLDDNCDGEADEGLPCLSGEAKVCGSNIGVCREGTRTCTGCDWGECEGSYGPFEEICGNGLDDNCNGEADEADCIAEVNAPCAYGAISGSCRCGDNTYSFGYCCDNIWGLKACKGISPWIWVSVGGAAVLIVLAILVLHFRRSGRELTWEELYSRWR